MTREQIFSNLEHDYEVWLGSLKQNGFSAAGHYAANLKAIGEPISLNTSLTAKWNGLYELLTGVRPAKGVYEIKSVGEFAKIYGSAVSFFTAEKNEKERIRHLYPNCACFDDLFAFAYQNGNATTLGDGGHTRNGFIKYCQFLCELEAKVDEKTVVVSNDILKSRQKIVYGAPGTGKSFRLNTDTADDENVFRVTFHPDSDYASFVGAYKPTMDPVPRMAMNGTEVKLATFDTAIGAEDLAKIKSEKRVAYEFVPQAFMNAYVAAWKNYAAAGDVSVPEDVYLIIEEINRGNCAQVFGDIFQLLDRSDSGWSTYPILADRDLGEWLGENHFSTAAFAPLENMSAPDRIKQPDWDAVRKGKMLLLPPNLYIWATMNTSDQSLFPIDSAFKRRWDWEYVPIREGKFKDGPKQGQKMQWKVQVGSSHYDWWEFLKNVNQRIFKITESEDKELGYFFVKPDGKTNPQKTENDQISSKRFVGKVIFYLWNDVFKDYGIETIFKASDAGGKSGEEAKGAAFQSFFKEDDDKVNEEVLESFFKQLELQSDEKIAAAQPAASAAAQANEEPVADATIPEQATEETPTATDPQSVR